MVVTRNPVPAQSLRGQREQEQEQGIIFCWRRWQVRHLRAHVIVWLCQQMVPSFGEALAAGQEADEPPLRVRTLARLSERLARLCPRGTCGGPESEPERAVEIRLRAHEQAALRWMGRALTASSQAERPSVRQRLALLSLAHCRGLLAGLRVPSGEARLSGASAAGSALSDGRQLNPAGSHNGLAALGAGTAERDHGTGGN